MAFSFAADMEALAYTSGSVEFTAAETLTGAVGGATAVVVTWDLDSGGWGAGTAAGTVWVKSVTGTFQAEALNGSVGGADMATASDASFPDYSSLNWLRTIIGDTDSAYPLFVDAELNAIITKCTDGTVDFDKAKGILLRVLSVDPIRLVESRKATSGGIALIDECNMYAKRGEVYLD